MLNWKLGSIVLGVLLLAWLGDMLRSFCLKPFVFLSPLCCASVSFAWLGLAVYFAPFV